MYIEHEARGKRIQHGSADRNCFSPIRCHYHAPPCSNGFVKCQTGRTRYCCVQRCGQLWPSHKKKETLSSPPAGRSYVPPPLPQKHDCAAKLWLLLLPVSSLHRPCPGLWSSLFLTPSRSTFLRGCWGVLRTSFWRIGDTPVGGGREKSADSST